MKSLTQLFSLYIILSTVFCSCNDSENYSIDFTNEDVEKFDSTKISMSDSKSKTIYSVDSIYQLRIFKTIGKLSLQYSEIHNDERQFYCVEVVNSDGTPCSFEKYIRRSKSSPEHYLLASFTSNNYKVESKLRNPNFEKVQFYFSTDFLTNLTDSVELIIDYGKMFQEGYGLFGERKEPYIRFELNDIKNISQPTDTVVFDIETPEANDIWFNQQGLSSFTTKSKT
jgi:hypothetical protein